VLNSRLGRYGGRPVALAVLMVVLFLTFLDNTVVSVALGSVQSDLHAGVTFLQWVVSAYVLTFAGAMLACGMVGDELGRKRVMLSGVAVFCASSVPCALAPSVQVLIAGRAVMGLEAAASEPGRCPCCGTSTRVSGPAPALSGCAPRSAGWRWLWGR